MSDDRNVRTVTQKPKFDPVDVEKRTDKRHVESFQSQINSCAQAKAEEFHNRLKFNIKKLTCHINRDRIAFEKMLNGYNEDEAKTLCRVLYLEMLQVIQAVKEAK